MLAEFVGSDPGSTGLPQTDGTLEVADTYPDGYWSFTANTFSSSNYSINLDGAGFAESILPETRIIKRTASGNWGLDGTHSNAVGTVCYRNNLTGNISSSGTHFAFGHGRPVITDQPDDLAVCESANVSFSITATGLGLLTYKWYKVPATPLSDGGRLSGTSTPTLNISNVIIADAGSYYCIVTDVHGQTRQSNSAALTV
ncbi:MAG: immunoglobulin domain-containing protein, partial [Marinilabiliales bacterium]|nr:immunoglobulin domain-containing protein [Marinilabiliales bacterium]